MQTATCKSRSHSAHLKPPLPQTHLTATIAVLDEFQYKSRWGPSDTKSVLNLLESKQSVGMHVTDLWSKKQHQCFLKALKAVDAQKVRDKVERFRLFNASVKHIPGHTLDELYNRLLLYSHPNSAVRNYALGRPGLINQEISSSLRFSTSTRSLKRAGKSITRDSERRKTTAIDQVIHRCDVYESELEGKERSRRSSQEVRERRRIRREMHLREVV